MRRADSFLNSAHSLEGPFPCLKEQPTQAYEPSPFTSEKVDYGRPAHSLPPLRARKDPETTEGGKEVTIQEG